jgi:TonB family protein
MIATVKVDEDRLTLFVRKFRSLCDMHSVRFGTQDNFGAFVRQVVEDKKFAMDFWAFVSKFSSREGGELSDEQMLNVIVQEIAACDMTAADESLKQQIDLLRRMLAGEDIQSSVVHDQTHEDTRDTFIPPVESPVQPRFSVAPPAEAPSAQMFSDPSPSPKQAEKTQRAFESIAPPSPIPEPAIRAKDPIDQRENQTTKNPPPDPLHDSDLQTEQAVLMQHQLDEALSRLELNSLELKLHLDNIDSRMSRMEPHLEELAAKVLAARESIGRRPTMPEPVRELPPTENQRHIQESVGRAVERSRLVLEPPPVPLNTVVEDDDPSIPIPLENYPQRRFNRSLGLFAALLLIGVVGSFALHRQYGASLWHDFGSSLQEKYASARQELRDAMKGHTTDAAVSAEQSKSDDSSGSSPVQPEPAPSVAAVPGPYDNAKPAKQSDDTPAEAHPKHKTHLVGTSPERALASSTDASVDSALEAPVAVAPAVMEENLVVSRVPAYPDVARADRIEGPVVMQAIISKSGTVGHLHVIQGDPLLRSAASEAVSKWRYRPYTVNGKPVEVATTVTVDFKLNH